LCYLYSGLNFKDRSNKFMEITPHVGSSHQEQKILATVKIASDHLQLLYNLYEYASETNWSIEFFNFIFLDTKFAYLMSENGQRNVQSPIIKLSMYVPVPNFRLHQWSYQLWCCKNSRVGKTGALASKTCWFSCMSHHGTFAKRSKITWLDLSHD
jgi:hypothetical protein